MSTSQIYTSIEEFFDTLPKIELLLLVAVSGGSDSVALVYLLNFLKEQIGIKRIAIVHVNHNLRGEESDGDELFVKEIARKIGCEYFSKRLYGLDLKSPGVEQIARKERYDFFHSLQKEHGFNYIVTGHTLDDQAETVLYRLIRGTGLTGLRAIHQVRADGVIRPLLSISKKDLIEWLHEKSITFRVDSSNEDTRYSRNFIRHKILPAISEMEPTAIQRIAGIAKETAAVWPIIEKSVNRWIKNNVVEESDKFFIIQKIGFCDHAVASQAIHQIFKLKDVEISSKHISYLIRNISRKSGQFLLAGNWSFFPLKEKVFFQHKNYKISSLSVPLKNPGTTEIIERKIRITINHISSIESKIGSSSVSLDEEKCGNELIYRTIKPDDCIIPLGWTTQTNALTFLAKQGVAKIERERIGVIVNSNNKLVWILGIRIDNSVRVTKQTTRIINLTFQALCDIV